MTTQSALMARVSETHAQPFTPGIMGRDEDRLALLTDIFKTPEALGYIELLSLRIESDESKIGYTRAPDGTMVRRWKSSEIDSSRLEEVQLKYRIRFDDEEEIIERAFAIPKLVDGTFFHLRGSTYFPIYQIADRGTSVSRSQYSLKTLLMPIQFIHRQVVLKDINKNELAATEFRLNMFKRKLNVLEYYVAKWGLENAVRYWGYEWDNDLALLSPEYAAEVGKPMKDLLDEYAETCYIFKVGKNSFLIANKNSFTDKNAYNFLHMICSFLKNCRFPDVVEHAVYQDRFGGIFTKNNTLEKCESVLFSFERILDKSTQKSLSNVPEEDRADTYAVIRYILREFETSRWKDDQSLENKRLQCWEYILNPLLLLLSSSAYRVINTRALTMKILTSIFNFSYMFLIKRILVNDFVRYNGCCNTIEVFSTYKATFKGLAAGGGEASARSRSIHPSHIGNLTLVTTSGGDPGLVVTICPFAVIKDGVFVDRFRN